ncbi:MAG: hypothetical protein GF384_03470 [Elusimicrobia bacterium]|nr:hypothetical protein [Elusimicrobiota bacterium]MBD3411973.1 hypothetical protein [Elusimicrobiota bacterium]
MVILYHIHGNWIPLMFNIRSKVERKIIRYFLINTNAKSYINQLARTITEDPKNVYRYLQKLEQDGLLTSSYSGKERYFSLNTKNQLLKEYKKIFLKTEGAEHLITNILKQIKGIHNAFIFGSYASKAFNESSDIDLLIISTTQSIEIQKRLFPLQKTLNREINIINLTPEEFLQRKQNKDQVLNNILTHKHIKII